MRKLLLGSAMSLAMLAGASAADYPAPYKAPPPAPAGWTGFYVNGGGGYGMWTAAFTTIDPPGSAAAGTCSPASIAAQCIPGTQGGKGWFGTVGGGYDLQFGKIVAGVLADVDFGSISGTISDPSPFFTGTIKQTLAWSVGARLGWLINPATLSYVNGGYSQTRFSGASMIKTDTGAPASAADGCAGCATPPFTHGGWFIGGGMEAMVSPGLFWRSEYRYADYGTTTLPDCSSVAPFSCALEPEIVFHPVVQTIRSELVYKFNWGGGPL